VVTGWVHNCHGFTDGTPTEAFRGSVQRHLHLKRRERGFDGLRKDPGLAERLGRPVPGAEAARKFLYQLHDEEKLEQAPADTGRCWR
jgi:hypothetical protein